MTSKVIECYKSLSNFSVNSTLPLLDGPLMLPSPNCLVLSFFYSLSISLYISLFCSMQTLIYTQRNILHKMKYNLKGHMTTLLCRVILKKISDFFILTTYGQLLPLFCEM